MQIMTLLFFLAYLNPFISFSCYIVPAWTWNTVLNWSSNNGHLCFVLNPTGNAFSVNRYFVDTFIRLRKFPSNPSMLRGFFFFFFQMMLNFIKRFSILFDIVQIIFLFQWMALVTLNILIGILMLKQSGIYE